jgi:hypothetical protein
VHAPDGRSQIGNQLAEGLAQRFPSTDQHIVMMVAKVIGACCHSRAKAALDAIALGRIARLLGDGKANAGHRIVGWRCLQPKRRPPGAIAPGSP